MRVKICSVGECENPAYCRGWCNKHYIRWRNHGDPLIILNNRDMGAEKRFWSKVEKTDKCWLWTGGRRGKYGHFWFDGRGVLPHRFAYELLVGPIPEGLDLDHVKDNGCESTLCVKAIADGFGPAHLEPVTSRINVLRGDTITSRNYRKTHCLRGHELKGSNLYPRPDGKRDCLVCRKERASSQ